ncbi:hypothetical protein CBL_02751 [Carabus blaptoides fortunei]
MPFGISMVWREAKDHTDICTVKTSGYNKKNKCNIEYPNLPSAIRPVPHSPEIPVPAFVTPPTLQGQCDVDEESNNSRDSNFVTADDSVCQNFDQHELNDLVRNLGLSKQASELLASRLREKKLLENGTKSEEDGQAYRIEEFPELLVFGAVGVFSERVIAGVDAVCRDFIQGIWIKNVVIHLDQFYTTVKCETREPVVKGHPSTAGWSLGERHAAWCGLTNIDNITSCGQPL